MTKDESEAAEVFRRPSHACVHGGCHFGEPRDGGGGLSGWPPGEFEESFLEREFVVRGLCAGAVGPAVGEAVHLDFGEGGHANVFVDEEIEDEFLDGEGDGGGGGSPEVVGPGLAVDAAVDVTEVAVEGAAVSDLTCGEADFDAVGGGSAFELGHGGGAEGSDDERRVARGLGLDLFHAAVVSECGALVVVGLGACEPPADAGAESAESDEPGEHDVVVGGVGGARGDHHHGEACAGLNAPDAAVAAEGHFAAVE